MFFTTMAITIAGATSVIAKASIAAVGVAACSTIARDWHRTIRLDRKEKEDDK